MDKAIVIPADLTRNLTDGLDKGLALDIAYRAADFGDDDVRARLLADGVDERLYLVGDVGNNLDGLAQLRAVALLVEHVPIHLTRGKVRVFV